MFTAPKPPFDADGEGARERLARFAALREEETGIPMVRASVKTLWSWEIVVPSTMPGCGDRNAATPQSRHVAVDGDVHAPDNGLKSGASWGQTNGFLL